MVVAGCRAALSGRLVQASLDAALEQANNLEVVYKSHTAGRTSCKLQSFGFTVSIQLAQILHPVCQHS